MVCSSTHVCVCVGVGVGVWVCEPYIGRRNKWYGDAPHYICDSLRNIAMTASDSSSNSTAGPLSPPTPRGMAPPDEAPVQITHTCTHTHTHTRSDAHICTHSQTLMHTHARTHTHMHSITHRHTNTHSHTLIHRKHAFIHTYTHYCHAPTGLIYTQSE